MSVEKNLVDRARQAFEKDLFAKDYAAIHLDAQHLENLLKEYLFPAEGKQIIHDQLVPLANENLSLLKTA